MIRTVHWVTFSPCGGTNNVMKAVGRDLPLPRQEHDIPLSCGSTSTCAFSLTA